MRFQRKEKKMRFLIVFFLVGCVEIESPMETTEKHLQVVSDVKVDDRVDRVIESPVLTSACDQYRDCPDAQRQECNEGVCEYAGVTSFIEILDGRGMFELNLKGDLIETVDRKFYYMTTVRDSTDVIVEWKKSGGKMEPYFTIDLIEYMITGNVVEEYVQQQIQWRYTGKDRKTGRASVVLVNEMKEALTMTINWIER